MRIKESKTTRFEALLKDSGVPEQATLWTKPEGDADFMKAVRSNRVVTLLQQNIGTKKDYGLVGFFAEKNATFLVFPRPIKAKAETKVVGIKYDRIASPAPKGAVFKGRKSAQRGVKTREETRFQLAAEEKKKLQDRSTAEQAAKVKRLPHFKATVQLVAKETAELHVEAENRKEAEKLLRKRASKLSLDLGRAEVRRSIKGMKKLSA